MASQKKARQKTKPDTTRFILPKKQLNGNSDASVRGQLRSCLDRLDLCSKYEQEFLLAVYLLPHLTTAQQSFLDGISEELSVKQRKLTPIPESHKSTRVAGHNLAQTQLGSIKASNDNGQRPRSLAY